MKVTRETVRSFPFNIILVLWNLLHCALAYIKHIHRTLYDIFHIWAFVPIIFSLYCGFFSHVNQLLRTWSPLWNFFHLHSKSFWLSFWYFWILKYLHMADLLTVLRLLMSLQLYSTQYLVYWRRQKASCLEKYFLKSFIF